MLTLSFATSDNEALTKLMQDSNSRAVVQSIRAYTSYLEQHGQSEVASKIKSDVIEKALTTNLSTVANATVQAINYDKLTLFLLNVCVLSIYNLFVN